MDGVFEDEFNTDIFDELDTELGDSTLTEYFNQDFEPLNGELFDIFDNSSDGSDSGIDCLPISPTSSDSNSEHPYAFESHLAMDDSNSSSSPSCDTATIYVVEDPSGTQRIVIGNEVMNWDATSNSTQSIAASRSQPVFLPAREPVTINNVSVISQPSVKPLSQTKYVSSSKVPNVTKTCGVVQQSPIHARSQLVGIKHQPQQLSRSVNSVLPVKSASGNGSSLSTQAANAVSVKLLVPNTQQSGIVMTASGSGSGIPIVLSTVASAAPPVDYFVNSKVKIQPKPQQELRLPQNGSTVLNLAQQSELYQTVGLPAMEMNSIPSPLSGDDQLYAVEVNDSNDLKLLKRHHRMIKNRESASLSRKRRKDYLKTLEDSLKNCLAENQNLAKENKALKRRIDDLQGENEKLRKFGGANTKKTAGFLAVVFLVALNLRTGGIIMGDAPSGGRLSESIHIPHASSDGSHRFGRTLMSVDDTNDVTLQQALDALRRGFSDLNDTTALSLRNSIMCPTYHNQTDSIRLVNELRSWVLGHKEEWRRQATQPPSSHHHQQHGVNDAVKRMEQQQSTSASNRRRKSSKANSSNKQAALHVGSKDQPQASQGQGHQYELQLFMSTDSRYRRFLNAIHRRNDTFYVVSFHKDHLLLPATYMNKTAHRPRMSFVMPAIGLNDTMQPPEGSIAMMQVDCDVTATRLIHLHSSAVPHAANNATFGPRRRAEHESWLDID